MPKQALSVLLPAILCGSLLICSLASSQQSEVDAPSAVAHRMNARAHRFLRDVAALSPAPPGTDAERAQAWPRQGYEEIPAGSSLRFPRQVSDGVVAGRRPRPRFGPEWEVRFFGNDLAVTIDARTEAVTSFQDHRVDHALSRDPAPDPSARISPSKALERAEMYLSRTGIPIGELAYRGAEWIDRSRPFPTAATTGWRLSWDRVWHGIKFEDQWAFVELDARLGRLQQYSAALGASPPRVEEVRIPPNEVEGIVQKFLAGEKLTASGPVESSLRIVMPTEFWNGRQPPSMKADPNTRFAWVTRTKVKLAPGQLNYADLWVDAADGRIVGGKVWGYRGAAPEPSATPEPLRIL